MSPNRDHFSAGVKKELGEQVGYLCSFRGCGRLTVGPSEMDDGKRQRIGEACHIHAAAPNGPRYDASQSEEERNAAANGIWLCCNHHKLIDGDARAYPAVLLRKWKAAAIERARVWLKDGVSPLAEPAIQLGDFMPIVDWISLRWRIHLDKEVKQFPVLHEFEQDRVYFPKDLGEQVFDLLDRDRLALVSGPGCCGKSVFGAALALSWQHQKAGTCLWLDLREQDEANNDHRQILKGFAHWNRGPLLLVIDNAHLDEKLVQWLQDELRARELARPHCHVLLLSRPAPTKPAWDRYNLFEQLAPFTVPLAATVETFAGVARRLFLRLEREPSWTEPQYKGWLSNFGGDLIAFGLAVVEALAKNGLPSIKHALDYARQHYLDQAKTAQCGERPLLRMCAMASLDMSIHEQGLGEAFDKLYPQLAREALATPLRRGDHPHWQFQHAGLGEFLLKAALSSGQTYPELRGELLLEAVARGPFILSYVCRRLRRQEYAASEEFRRWKSRVPGNMIESHLMVDPLSAISMGKQGILKCDFGVLDLRLDEFCKLQRRSPPSKLVRVFKYVGEERAKVILAKLLEDGYEATLAQAPPKKVVMFLKYLGGERAKGILNQLLNGGYQTALAQTAPNEVVAFLRHVGGDRAKRILAKLIEDGYEARLAQAPPHFVVTFLIYVGGERAKVMLIKLIEDGYEARLKQAAPHFVVDFLRYVGAERAKGMLAKLIEDGYGATLAQAAPHLVVTFFRYVGEDHARAILAKLMDGGYETTLARAKPRELVSFLKYVGDERAKVMLSKLLEGGYEAKLAEGGPIEVVNFLKYVGDERAKGLLTELIKGGYTVKLAHLTINKARRFFRFMGVNFGPSGTAAIYSGWLANVLERQLQNRDVQHIARLLDHTFELLPDHLPRIDAWLCTYQDTIVGWAEKAGDAYVISLTRALARYRMSPGLIKALERAAP